MKDNTLVLAWRFATAALPLAGCAGAPPQDSVANAAAPAGEAVTLWTSRVELFIEYPMLVAGRLSEPWAVHVTILDGFQPAATGALTLEFRGGDGNVHRVVAAAPARPGIYGPQVELPAAGAYDLLMTYRGRGLAEEIWVGPVYVYASEAEFPGTPPEPETGIALPKEQQWATPFGTAEVVARPVAEAVAAPGELVAPDGGMVAVEAPLAGTLTAAANGDAPSIGARVRKGEVLAVLTSADGEGSWAALVARVERLERETRRLESLYAVEAIPERRLVETRQELLVARRALEAHSVAADSGAELRVRAPIDGVIVERQMVAGARVRSGDPLFTVAAPGQLWARFHVPAAQAPLLARVEGATYRVEGDTALRRAGRRVAMSQVIDPTTRSLTITFAAPNPDGALRVGMLARGYLLLGEGEPGPAIPAAAIRMEEGLPVAYVQVAGELFQRRPLEVGASDGEWTRVLRGVSPGERVVVRGAYQVRLASLNPAAVSDHGHPH